MLLQHSFYYLLARGAPAAVSFLAVALYTRLLSPAEYGLYALVISAVGLANAALFQWLRLGLLRFLPAYREKQARLLSTLALGFGVLAGLTGVAGGVGFWIWPGSQARTLLGLGILLLWAQAWFELNLELVRSQLKPHRYGLLALAKSVSALAAGGLLAYLGRGVTGILLGLLLGFTVPLLGVFRRHWNGVRPGRADFKTLRRLLGYGLPLTAAFILDFVVNSSDRLLLGWLSGSAAAGLYSAGYDLAKKSLWMLMMAVNLASYPLVVRALEKEGRDAARSRLRDIAIILLGVGLPGAAGLALLAPNLAGVLLGVEFRDAAAALVPWIALAVLLAGLKAYYLDMAFQLGRHTVGQVWVLLVAAVVNLGLNLCLIPLYGFMGAAYATVAAYAAGFVLSGLWGRRVFPLPFPGLEPVKIILAAGGMTLALRPVAGYSGPVALAAQVTWGVLVYGTLLLALNAGQSRRRLVQFLRNGRF